MQFKRKNVIITSMILLLFVIGYAYNMFTTDNYIGVNYDIGLDQTSSQDVTTDNAQAQPADKATSAQTKENGESTAVVEQNPDAVQASSSMASTFFSEYRMEREKNRSKEVEMWKDVINSQNSEKTFKDQAQQELLKTVALTTKEMEIENLVISLGFSDALAFITDDSATILVEAKDLAPAQVAKIQDIVIRKTKFSPSNIKIMKKS
jgi:stage III sporulation protein AH